MLIKIVLNNEIKIFFINNKESKQRINMVNEKEECALINPNHEDVHVCFQDTNMLEAHQERVKEYFSNEEADSAGLLLYHDMGSGKTCTFLHVAYNYIKKIYFGNAEIPAQEINKLFFEKVSQLPEIIFKHKKLEYDLDLKHG